MDNNHRFHITTRGHDLAYWGLLALACILFLVMNVLTPFKEDDMGFTLIDGEWSPIRSLTDALRSYANHYGNTNGRLSDAVPTLFAGLLGKRVFDVCNTLVFGLLLHLLSLLSVRRRSVTVLAMFLAVVGTCYPVPGETMLWMAGSANYMWAITLSLLLVYCLRRSEGKPLGWGRGVLLLLGAVIAGGFNEATSFGFFAGLCLYYLFNRTRFNRWAAVALVGYLLGLSLIVASPAAWHRAADGGIVLNLGFGDLLSSRWYIFQEKLWQYYVPSLALAVGVVALFVRRGCAVKQCEWTYVFLCLALVLLALGNLHERVYAPWVTVAFIIVAMGLEVLMSRWRWLRVAALAVSLGLALFTFARGIKVLNEYKAYDGQVEAEITAQPDQAVLRARQFDGYSRFIKPMNYISTNFFGHEVVYRAYFGKKNVQFVSDSVYKRFQEGRLLEGAQELKPDSDRPDVAEVVYTFPGQDYVAVLLKTPSLPATSQVARYYVSPTADAAVSGDEAAKREKYGISLDYEPRGFYPLEYQGQNYLICENIDLSDNIITFPLSLAPDDKGLTLGGQ